jgi:hypothetical protein
MNLKIALLPTSTTDVLPWYLMVACGLESHKLIPISSNTSFTEVGIKSLPLVIKQNDQSKFEEEIKKILKKALISKKI